MTSAEKKYETRVLLDALARPTSWPHPVEEVSLIETHISWVLLTGEFAYKIKRPLDLGFLDFTTLEKRRDACREELRLNRRTASNIYLAVVAICGDPSNPRIVEGPERPDDVFEYAVKMRQFDQQCQLDRQLALGDLEPKDLEALARHVAGFHDSIPRAHPGDPWDRPERLAHLSRENFEALVPLVDDTADRDTLTRLGDWTRRELERLTPVMERRFAEGFVREGHGDLHLANIARFRGGFVAFDCIEFDPLLRWMDVMSEVGFLVMDLAARHRVDLAWSFLNRYLALSGDYGGTATLRFYIVYAALVRAKIAAIRAEQEPPGCQTYADQARLFRMHLGLAERAVRPRRPVLLMTHGYSGSGKSWLTARLATALPAIRVRSDLERKRLHGLSPAESSGADAGTGIYDEASSARVYQHLRHCADAALSAQFDVIVDAACLKNAQRQLFYDLARNRGAQLILLDCTASDRVLRGRLRKRVVAGTDVSEAGLNVLNFQQQNAEELSDSERAVAVSVDTSDDIDPLRVTGAVCSLLGRETAD